MPRAVSVFLLVAMASLPVSGAICGIRCLAPADLGFGHEAHAGMHGHGEHTQTQAPGQASWRPVSQDARHDCDDHPGTLREAMTIPMAKVADLGTSSVVHGLMTAVLPNVPTAARPDVAGYSPPEQERLPTRAPLVLRI